MRLLLASASPRRAELLRQAGFEFDVLATDVDERIHPGEPADVYVRRLAAEKSARAAHGRPDSVVLGADTAVVVDDAILGKPADDREAAAMLRRLSGRGHIVMTGVSVRAGVDEVGLVEATRVEFSRLTEDDIAWYAASGEGRDKAGAYAVQGLASRFVTRIEGSYANVVGLPVSRVYDLLRRVGASR